MVWPLWRTVWRFLKKLKIELPYDPVIPLLGIYLDKTIIQKDTGTPGTSLVVQWLRLRLPMQAVRVPSLVGELRSHMPLIQVG